MKVDFDSDEDSVAQAYILVEALAKWLAEQQPKQPIRPGHAEFTYRADHSLDNVRIVLDEV